MQSYNNDTSILIADDHPVVLKGLKQIISNNFPGCLTEEVTSIHELEISLKTKSYSHLILDLNLSDGSALSLFPDLITNYPLLQILIYSMVTEYIYAQKVFSLKVSGFLGKTAHETEIIQALHIFFKGGYYISKPLKGKVMLNDEENMTNMFTALSITELNVLGDLLKGNRPKEIAAALKVRPQTITTYKARIFQKLGTDNIVEIQRMADLYNINFS